MQKLFYLFLSIFNYFRRTFINFKTLFKPVYFTNKANIYHLWHKAKQ